MLFQTTFQELEPKAAPQPLTLNAEPPVATERTAGGQLKKCFKCQQQKSRDQFYSHPSMGDGLLGKCKDCCKADIAENINKRKLDPAWITKERQRGRDKMAARRAAGLTERPKSETIARWNNANQHKRRAQAIAAHAQSKQVLQKPDRCEICKQVGYVEKHHPDYSKPLLIQWLCTACHGLTRRKI